MELAMSALPLKVKVKHTVNSDKSFVFLFDGGIHCILHYLVDFFYFK